MQIPFTCQYNLIQALIIFLIDIIILLRRKMDDAVYNGRRKRNSNSNAYRQNSL